MIPKKKAGSESVPEGEQKLLEEKDMFEFVLNEELSRLDDLRDPDRGSGSKPSDPVYQRAFDSNLAGLAFSGGGIRSATFNLGVIQALSHLGMLSRFDYLSTVSGGGFVGGWLSALLHRQAAKDGKVNESAVREFQKNLEPHPAESGFDHGEISGFKAIEHKAVRYLRGYSNYLSPRLGLSGDALAAASIFLRNFVLIQLVLITLLASILLFFYFVGAASIRIEEDTWLLPVAALFLVVAVIAVAWQSAANRMNQKNPALASLLVFCFVILPCVFAAWAFCTVIVTPKNPLNPATLGIAGNAFLGRWILAGAIGYGLAWALGFLTTQRMRSSSEEERSFEENARAVSKNGSLPVEDKDKNEVEDEDAGVGSWYQQSIAAAVAGGVLGLLMFVTVHKLPEFPPINTWHAVAFGPPLFLLALLFVVTIHIGGASRAFTEPDREWFARLGGFVMWVCAAWVLIFSLILYATPLVQWLAGGGLAAFITWAAGSSIGAWLAHGPSTGGKGSISWKEIAAKIAPWLFLAGLGVIVAYATHMALLKFVIEDYYQIDVPGCSGGADFCAAAANTLEQLNVLGQAEQFRKLAYVLVGTVFVFFLFAWRFDINLFSLHAMYCNRIARAYLGASSAKRWPNPFTGFDRNDDLQFDKLANQRPIPIINTAINMTGGDDLAWQTRHAASFAFTPAWSGYETRSTQGIKLGTYRPTSEYADRRKLGTLMAVSGAAASPNMGYHTKPGVAALMTAFNLRLGRWCGNPTRDCWKQASPWLATRPIFAELTGSATAQAAWINLTDGGHFDNLGVYELIRRRCRLIVVTDAGCDPDYHFEDLSNTILKCWTDFGVNIRFEHFEPMYHKEGSRYGSVHGVVGRIEYDSSANTKLFGVIIYLKSSMTGDEWPDIRQYADTHEKFPHESTADQFFDENQFEAYRHLGYKVAAKMVKNLSDILGQGGNPDDVKNISIADIVNKLLEFSDRAVRPVDPKHRRGDLT